MWLGNLSFNKLVNKKLNGILEKNKRQKQGQEGSLQKNIFKKMF